MCDVGCPCVRLQPFVFRTNVRRKGVISEVEPEQPDVLASALGALGADAPASAGGSVSEAGVSLVAERFVHACGAGLSCGRTS